VLTQSQAWAAAVFVDEVDTDGSHIKQRQKRSAVPANIHELLG
jgi:hypothetical protein